VTRPICAEHRSGGRHCPSAPRQAPSP
jgi:hypothetical protein